MAYSSQTFIIPNSLYASGILAVHQQSSVPAERADAYKDFNINKRIVDPFDPEATVPMPFQLDEQLGSSVWKRNERERYRVRCVNEGFEKLRKYLPVSDSEKRISKVDTLRLAIRYIRHLDATLRNDQHTYKCRCFHGFQEESEGNIQINMDRKNNYDN